jgi:hypothetical protein
MQVGLMMNYVYVIIQVAAVDEGVRGANEGYQNSDDEAEHAEDAGDYYQAEDDDYEVHWDAQLFLDAVITS